MQECYKTIEKIEVKCYFTTVKLFEILFKKTLLKIDLQYRAT